MSNPGDTVPIPGWSMSGRGQEYVVPYADAQHILRMRTVSVSDHEDHYLSADEALEARVRRLKEQGVKYTLDGNRLTYTGYNGNVVILEYLTPETADALTMGAGS